MFSRLEDEEQVAKVKTKPKRISEIISPDIDLTSSYEDFHPPEMTYYGDAKADHATTPALIEKYNRHSKLVIQSTQAMQSSISQVSKVIVTEASMPELVAENGPKYMPLHLPSVSSGNMATNHSTGNHDDKKRKREVINDISTSDMEKRLKRVVPSSDRASLVLKESILEASSYTDVARRAAIRSRMQSRNPIGGSDEQGIDRIVDNLSSSNNVRNHVPLMDFNQTQDIERIEMPESYRQVGEQIIDMLNYTPYIIMSLIT
jgi:hypothetical protein